LGTDLGQGGSPLLVQIAYLRLYEGELSVDRSILLLKFTLYLKVLVPQLVVLLEVLTLSDLLLNLCKLSLAGGNFMFDFSTPLIYAACLCEFPLQEGPLLLYLAFRELDGLLFVD
jgi:hypothetical protein